MESYREEIEKEAEEYWRLNRCENKGFLVYELFNGGVNSKISERIKIDFAVECLNEIIFIEVKTRKSLLFGTPEEAYSLKKQDRIIKAALGYLKDNNINKSFQIDLVALILNDKNEVLSIAMYDNAINY